MNSSIALLGLHGYLLASRATSLASRILNFIRRHDQALGPTDAPPAEALNNERSPVGGGRGQRILFLDDDVGFVELAERVIGKAGYRVIAHFNPVVALAEFSAAPDAFDLVVVDLAMPDASGIDIARGMMAVRADIPIIMTAGYFSPDDEARATTCGVREVISKSATVQELYMAFGRVFGAGG